jgi:hypothetical protein
LGRTARSSVEDWPMWHNDEDEAAPVEISTERTAIGMNYLVLVGALLSGVLHLIAS